MKKEPEPLFDLKVGELITNGFTTIKWLGTMMGTKGFWRVGSKPKYVDKHWCIRCGGNHHYYRCNSRIFK